MTDTSGFAPSDNSAVPKNPEAEGGPAPVGLGVRPGIASELRGSLPCIACRYELRGLSVRDVCPECGTAVRATILAVVDPYAQVLRPIRYRWLLAACVILWPLAGLVAALMTWGIRIGGLMHASDALLHLLLDASTIAILLCTLGAVGLVQPHSGIPRARRISAGLGVLTIAILGAVHVHLLGGIDPVHIAVYADPEAVHPARSMWRLVQGALVILALALLRPNARLLTARSLLMRLGQVDRQTMRALAMVVAVGMAGDVLQLLGAQMHAGSSTRTVVVFAGLFCIVASSILITVGLATMVRDSLRIAPVIVKPAPSLQEVLAPVDVALQSPASAPPPATTHDAAERRA